MKDIFNNLQRRENIQPLKKKHLRVNYLKLNTRTNMFLLGKDKMLKKKRIKTPKEGKSLKKEVNKRMKTQVEGK